MVVNCGKGHGAPNYEANDGVVRMCVSVGVISTSISYTWGVRFQVIVEKTNKTNTIKNIGNCSIVVGESRSLYKDRRRRSSTCQVRLGPSPNQVVACSRSNLRLSIQKEVH